MNNRKKAGLEILIQLISLGAGYGTHLLFERWDIALVITLAFECFLHFIAFMWLYRHLLDKLSEWTEGELNPLLELGQMVNELRSLRDNVIPLGHIVPAPRDWPFDEMFVQSVEDFKRNTQLISDGSYTLLMDDIQDVSLKVCDQMEQGAFCTALEENLDIFDTSRGAELLSAQYSAATRLATSQDTRTGFTRLFLFDDISHINRRNFHLMRENSKNKIEVLIAQKQSIASIFRRFELENRMDFGKWKHNLLMEIIGTEPERHLHVSKKDEDIRKANLLIRELRSAAYNYEEFLQHFKTAVNVRFWSTEPEVALRLDVPDGPHEVDCENLLKIALGNGHDVKRLGIYGLTQNLIDGASKFTNSSSHNLLGIDVIDARYYAPPKKSLLVNYIKANWLEWEPAGYKYDAIVADDVLCNLTFWQTQLFFEQVARTLNPNGLFLFRTTAKFSPGLVNPTWDDFIAEVQQFDHTKEDSPSSLTLDFLSPGAVYEMAWPTLHTDRFYDSRSRSLSFGDWNDAVTRDQRISVNLKNRLTFVRPLRLTSMEYQELRTMWMPHFRVAQAELPAYSKWENDSILAKYSGAKEVGRRFHEYYRLVVLQKAPL
jgi:SAM-dependent methyltransferase